jgi:hypothetical protein
VDDGELIALNTVVWLWCCLSYVVDSCFLESCSRRRSEEHEPAMEDALLRELLAVPRRLTLAGPSLIELDVVRVVPGPSLAPAPVRYERE